MVSKFTLPMFQEIFSHIEDSVSVETWIQKSSSAQFMPTPPHVIDTSTPPSRTHTFLTTIRVHQCHVIVNGKVEWHYIFQNAFPTFFVLSTFTKLGPKIPFQKKSSSAQSMLHAPPIPSPPHVIDTSHISHFSYHIRVHQCHVTTAKVGVRMTFFKTHSQLFLSFQHRHMSLTPPLRHLDSHFSYCAMSCDRQRQKSESA